jgi:hypothetical protein
LLGADWELVAGAAGEGLGMIAGHVGEGRVLVGEGDCDFGEASETEGLDQPNFEEVAVAAERLDDDVGAGGEERERLGGSGGRGSGG